MRGYLLLRNHCNILVRIFFVFTSFARITLVTFVIVCVTVFSNSGVVDHVTLTLAGAVDVVLGLIVPMCFACFGAAFFATAFFAAGFLAAAFFAGFFATRFLAVCFFGVFFFSVISVTLVHLFALCMYIVSSFSPKISVMDTYPSILDKMALAVESSKVAKTMVVQQDGIGEDMNFNLMGWRDCELVVVAQLSQVFMKDKEDRFARIIHAACVMRQGWDIDAFTFIAEGYCSFDKEATDGRDMAEVFSESDSPVDECLAFTHVDYDEILYVTVPYKCVPPRKVEFADALRYSGEEVLRDGRYPNALSRVLQLEVNEIDDGLDEDVFHQVLAEGLQEMGFEINYR